ncbi:hypothetical protein JIN85_03955 [Luteolibacter pohnpeiensis]|uniref:Lipoprotein n=1 Tax=Luteolibacter pohnpeiensis TaxID=454153 RepID=A0A934VUW2_9BACT|nr:hypothetical protein [Luteolibacter pohnpeiensis]MBK1881555.1 hypothetical protein [Luteolibacter pohnpeiensis]
MKTKLLNLTAVLLISVGAVSCMTTYDPSGRPVQSVDPGLAVAGVAAAGLLGYALADGNDHHSHHTNNYYRGPGPGHHHY